MTDIPFHRIAAAFYNRPLLLAPDAGANIAGFLAGRMRAGGGGGSREMAGETIEVFRARENPDGTMEAHSPRVSRFHGSTPIGADGRPLPFRRTENGVAIISIIGELVNRGAYIGASSGLVSYEGIRHQLRAAGADPLTRAVILDLESPGGEAVGAFEVAATVRELAAIKPVVALVDGLAASGGYAIASGATRIITIPTGQVGSIGVLWVHYDLSAALEDDGVKPTLLFAGAHKVDGNPFEPLPDDVRKSRQASIDAFYQQFVETVAAGRGRRLSVEAARGTQARVYTGTEAVRVGLADAVGSFEDVLSELSRPAASTTGRAGYSANAQDGATKAMTTNTTTPATVETPDVNPIATSIPDAGAAKKPNAAEGEDDEGEDKMKKGEKAATSGAPPVASAETPAAPPVAPPVTSAAPPALDPIAIVSERAAAFVNVSERAKAMGISIDVGAALKAGMTVTDVKAAAWDCLAARDAANVVVSTPPPAANVGGAKPSGLVAAAKAQAAKTRPNA